MGRTIIPHDPSQNTLAEACALVTDVVVAFEDVAEQIEDNAYALCAQGRGNEAVNALAGVARFFENMPAKSEEQCRDLADVYVMIGELLQYCGNHHEAIPWFEKAAIAADRWAVPFHCMATSFLHLGDFDGAVRCLEQEVSLEPGNYYSALQLVDVYERLGRHEKIEACLKNVLERHPDNIQALHRLVVYYEQHCPGVGVELLRRRLLQINRDFLEMEIIIKVYHYLQEKRHASALDFLETLVASPVGTAMAPLLKAYVYGELKQYARKRGAISEFVRRCGGKIPLVNNKIDEFRQVFGDNPAERIAKMVMIEAGGA